MKEIESNTKKVAVILHYTTESQRIHKKFEFTYKKRTTLTLTEHTQSDKSKKHRLPHIVFEKIPYGTTVFTAVWYCTAGFLVSVRRRRLDLRSSVRTFFLLVSFSLRRSTDKYLRKYVSMRFEKTSSNHF